MKFYLIYPLWGKAKKGYSLFQLFEINKKIPSSGVPWKKIPWRVSYSPFSLISLIDFWYFNKKFQLHNKKYFFKEIKVHPSKQFLFHEILFSFSKISQKQWNRNRNCFCDILEMENHTSWNRNCLDWLTF